MRPGEGVQALHRHGGVLLQAKILLPAAQCPNHFDGGLPVESSDCLKRVSQFLHLSANLVIFLGGRIRPKKVGPLAQLAEPAP